MWNKLPLTQETMWRITIFLLVSLLFFIRMMTPSDLENYAQSLNLGYISDLLWGDKNFLVQHDFKGVVMSKPPLHTWLMYPFVLLFGVDRFAISLVSFFSILLLALLIFEFTKQYFSTVTAGLAALTLLLAPPFFKQVAFVRTDPLFTLLIAFGAFSAFHAWNTGGSWLRFWLAGALSTLTKGPLGLILSAVGLFGLIRQQATGRTTSHSHCQFTCAFSVFLFITLSWFLSAWYIEGQALIDKMFISELIKHAIVPHNGDKGALKLLIPTGYLLARFLPFSLFLIVALKRVFVNPAEDPLERNLERFLTSWLLVGLLIFSLVKHQRVDHLIPLWPPAAILIARELSLLMVRFGQQRFLMAFLPIVIILLIGGGYKLIYHKEGSRSQLSRQLVVDAKMAAETFLQQGFNPDNLYYFKTPQSLHMYLKSYHQWSTKEEIERLLQQSSTPIFLALGSISLDDVKLQTPMQTPKLIFRWPKQDNVKPVFQVYQIRK